VAVRVGDKTRSSSAVRIGFTPTTRRRQVALDLHRQPVRSDADASRRPRHDLLLFRRAGPTLAIRPDGQGDVTKTHLRWRSLKGSPFIPSPLLYGDYLYMMNDISAS